MPTLAPRHAKLSNLEVKQKQKEMKSSSDTITHVGPQRGCASQSLTLCCVYHHLNSRAPEVTSQNISAKRRRPGTQEHTDSWDFRRSLEFRASSPLAPGRQPSYQTETPRETPAVVEAPPRTKNKPHRVTTARPRPAPRQSHPYNISTKKLSSQRKRQTS